MTFRRLTALVAVVAMWAIQGAGNADPKGGSGTITEFSCQIVVLFPNNSPAKLPADDNCAGGANGHITTATGKKGPTQYLFTSTYTHLNKNGERNMEAYNVHYQDDCGLLKGLPVVPPLGTANGDLIIRGVGHNLPPNLDILTEKPATLHAGFSLSRVGAKFIAPLIDPHMHNGHLFKGHKDSKPGGAGVIKGTFGMKPPLRDCANKGVVTVTITGLPSKFVNNVT